MSEKVRRSPKLYGKLLKPEQRTGERVATV